MAIKYLIGSVNTVIPSVYSTFAVANSLPSPAPAGRSVCILGEASEGIPGSELDLRLNYFTDFESVKDFYKTGSIVDAARQLFSNQPSPAFPGAIRRLYAYKTNNSTRAERTLEGPSGYGDLIAARFGEPGNLIKTRVLDSQTETLPTKTFSYLPSPSARSLRVVVNGLLNSGIALTANQLGSDLQPLLNALTDLSCTGGTARSDFTGILNINLAASNDTLTLTKDSGVGEFDASIQTGDVCYIAPGSSLAGAGNENAGAYIVVSSTTTSLVIKQMKNVDTAEENAVAFDVTSPVAVAVGDLKINAPLTVTYTGTTKVGTGATLELLEDNADKLGAGLLYVDSDFSNALASSTSSIASISASVPSAGKLTLSLSTGSWVSTPKVGDLIRIARGSLVAGATDKNVGAMIVESASSQTITASHLFSGMTTEAVSSVALNSLNNTVEYSLGFVSSDIAAKRIDSAAERKVTIEASRESDGVSTPDNSIGGRVVLEIGYYNVAATACTVSIDNQRIMTISPTGTGLTDIVVNTRKYSSLSELVTFLNTRTGVYARVPNAQYNSFSTSVLDMVDSVDCMEGQALPAYTARLKRDYSDWTTWFDDNFSLVAFREGALSLKAGLPDAEAASTFLDGATLGSTSSASIQSGLDAALKIDVRQVIPLFSRDASKDILDALTETTSSYSIDAIHASVKAHVSTASSTLFRKERFGMLSHYGFFADSKDKAAAVSYERCQMTFQLHNATDGDGNLVRFLPWMSACAVAAGRSQSILGTSMLRKPFLLSSVDHLGDVSLYSDSLVADFDPDDQGQLAEAIEAGLLVLKAVPGFGVRIEGPDNTTRSRENDPKAWVYERASVLFTADEVMQTVRSVLENFIGNRQSDTPTSVVRQAVADTLATFAVGTGNGSLLAYQIIDVQRVGVTYTAKVQIRPVEAIEAIVVDVLATRDL